MKISSLHRYVIFILHYLTFSSADEKTLHLGCYKESTDRKLTGYYYRDGTLSTTQCINECKARGFVYAGLEVGIECFCGNNQRVLEEKADESDCNFVCAGERSRRCGGNWRFNVFSVQDCDRVEQNTSLVYYVGCFKNDDAPKLLGHTFKDEKELTQDKCIKECQNQGFLYAGLQDGHTCQCGSQQSILEERTVEEDCNLNCPGDATKKCGGKSLMTLYSVSSCVKDGTEDYAYLGCFKDYPKRKLNGFYLKNEKMTPHLCVKTCKIRKFLYAGLQVGTECFCGNERTAIEEKVLDEECKFPCFGDSSKKCGADWRASIYSTTNIEKQAYRGCYKDEENRKLDGQYFINDYPLDGMTPKKCLYLCGQYKFMYAGLQVGVECFCGNKPLLESDKVPEKECDFGCTGDYAKKCGGNWRNSVYSTGYTTQDLRIIHKDSQYLGCYIDNVVRKFKGLYYKSESMTSELCVNLCYKLGYLYAATQVGSECYCGDTHPKSSEKMSEEDCQFKCFGDYSRNCGSFWRNSVYSTGYVGLGLTPTSDAEYNYQGCYKIMAKQEYEVGQNFGFTLSPAVCVEFCKRHWLSYAALYGGAICKCLSDPPSPEALVDDGQCITKCPGDDTKYCGGQDIEVSIFLSSVYDTGLSDVMHYNYTRHYLGCFNHNPQNIYRGYSFSQDQMTVRKCVVACKYYGYLYASLTDMQCTCGDKKLKDQDKIPEDSCGTPCAGESSYKCGGRESQSLYSTGSVIPEPTVADFGIKYLGCFNDIVKLKDLRAYIVDLEDQLDPKKCVDFCARLGFKYTGLLEGSQCLCGNKEPSRSFVVADHECAMRCSGREEHICGGKSRITAYASSVQSVDGEVDIRSRYLGCFRDKLDPRALRGSFKHSDKMTPWECVKECKKKNYLYAGLQVGSECYCGDQHPKQSQRLFEISCSFQCFGDSHRLCGGNAANSLYHTSSSGSEARVAELPYRYLGCYRDQENPRQLSSYFVDYQDNMVPLDCVETCKKRGYYYAGLQYGNKCYCGDTHPVPLDLMDESECNSKCTGAVTKLCGGNRRNSLYYTGNNQQALIDMKGIHYLGCYKDEETQRHLQGYSRFYGDLFAPIKCVELCKSRGYIYAGLQNSSQCFCGDQYPSPSDKLDDGQCNSRCTGDVSKICGGASKNSIYNTGFKGSPVVSVAQVGYQYIGCYTISDITFKKQENFNEQFTPQKCIDFCKEANHLYSGLHYGSSCYCWDSSPPQTSKVTEGECFSRCSADITKFCGGPSTMTAYMTSGDVEVNSSQGKPKKPQGCMISKTTVNGGQTCSNTVVFEESFSKSLSKKQWSHIVEIGEQPECPFVFFNSVGANSYTSNDKLIIKPSILPEDMVRNGALNLTECTARDQKRCAKKAVSFSILPPIQTARLTTKNSFSFLYGKIEVLAKLPIGDWIVPEIWLQPKTNSYGPDFISGQINIALSRGNRELNLDGVDLSCRHLECGVRMGVVDIIKENSIERDLDECWQKDFHNYTLLWTPDNMMFYIDGVESRPLLPDENTKLSNYLNFSDDHSSLWRFGSRMAPFDKEFYIHLGLSVGGTLFPDGVINSGNKKPWKNKQLKEIVNFWEAQKDWEPTWIGESALEIDYIKVTSL